MKRTCGECESLSRLSVFGWCKQFNEGVCPKGKGFYIAPSALTQQRLLAQKTQSKKSVHGSREENRLPEKPGRAKGGEYER
jgi:hypothetical protein